MPTPFWPINTGYDAGEISEKLLGNIKAPLYKRACKTLKNVIPLPSGPAKKRGGTRLVEESNEGSAADPKNVRLIEFIFSSSDGNQAYVLEFGDLTLRVFKGADNSLVSTIYDQDGNNGVSALTTPYAHGDLWDIQYEQSGDVIYLTDGANVPRKLTRYAHDRWEIAEFSEAVDPPWDTERSEDQFFVHDLTRTGDGSARNAFTAKPLLGSAAHSGLAWPNDRAEMTRFFDNSYIQEQGAYNVLNSSNYAIAVGNGNPYNDKSNIAINWPTQYFAFSLSGRLRVSDLGKYWIAVNGCETVDVSIDWENHVGHYDRHAAHAHNGADEFKEGKVFDLQSDFVDLRARMVFATAALGNWGITVAWRKEYGEGDDGEAYESGATSTNDYTITKNWNGNTIYDIRITYGAGSATWEYKELDDASWTTPGAPGVTYGADDALVDGGVTFATVNIASSGAVSGDKLRFRVGAAPIPKSEFSSSVPTGVTESDLYPWFVTTYQDRLWFAGSDQFPRRVWGSEIGRFHRFTPGSGKAADPIQIDLNSGKVDEIRGLAARKAFLVLTEGPLVTLESEGPALVPSDIAAIPQSYHGAASVRPEGVDDKVMMVDRSARRIRLIGFQFASDSYKSDELTVFTDLFLGKAIKEVKVQRGALLAGDEPVDVVWALTEDGLLRGCTFHEGLQVVAWHRHDLSAAGDGIHSIAVIPGTGGDELWLAVERAAAGGNYGVRIEYLDQDIRADALTYQVGISYVGGANTGGEEYFAGQKVALWDGDPADGGTLIGYDTCDGSGLFSIEGDEVATADSYMGIVYPVEIEPFPVEIQGEYSTSKMRKKRFISFGAELIDTKDLRINNHPLEDTAQDGTVHLKIAPGFGWFRRPPAVLKQYAAEADGTITEGSVEKCLVVSTMGKLLLSND